LPRFRRKYIKSERGGGEKEDIVKITDKWGETRGKGNY